MGHLSLRLERENSRHDRKRQYKGAPQHAEDSNGVNCSPQTLPRSGRIVSPQLEYGAYGTQKYHDGTPETVGYRSELPVRRTRYVPVIVEWTEREPP